MYSSASVCFQFLILFMVKIYVLGGPYLLCLDFMIYIFIGVHRCSINSELPSDLSSGFIVLIYSYISTSIFPTYLPATHLHRSFCLNYILHWFVPSSLYYDFDYFFNGPLVYTTFIMFYFWSGFWTLPVHWPLPLSSDFLSFFRNFLLSPLVHTSLVLFYFRLFLYLSIGLYPFVLMSFRLRFNFSLDCTAFSFFFSLFMFPLYHLLFNCQHIF